MKTFRDEKRTQEITGNVSVQIIYRQNLPGEGVIHFGEVQQGRIPNGAIAGEVFNQRKVWQRPIFRVIRHWRGIPCCHDNSIFEENKKESVQQYGLSQFNTKIIFLNYPQ